jgi:glutamate-1-semialdehyde 2,1-aminomutase
MAAGLATLRELQKQDYAALEERTLALATELKSILESKGLPVTLNHVASIFTLFLTEGPVTDFPSASTADGESFSKYYEQMRAQGVNIAPSGFECTFTSFAHTDEDFEKTLEAARKVRFQA